MHQRKSLVLILVQQRQNVCLSLHYSSNLFVNEKVIYMLKTYNKNLYFPNQFYLGETSHKFDYIEEVEELFLTLIPLPFLRFL